MGSAITNVILRIQGILVSAGITYCYENQTALFLQGLDITIDEIEVSVQWDLFEQAREALFGSQLCSIEKSAEFSVCHGVLDEMNIALRCDFNTVLATDIRRTIIQFAEYELAVRGLDALRNSLLPDNPLLKPINGQLQKLQQAVHDVNAQAWNASYQAWISRYGSAVVAAERIQKNPVQRLSPLQGYLGDVKGKRVANLLGSHGSKAVALAVLGAEVTVVDMSSGNAKYALELARACGVDIHYVVSDVLNLAREELTGDYDVVLMELGILHYFVALGPLLNVVKDLLRIGGKLILHEFHPVSTKLITSKGKKHKVTGNYFDTALHETQVAFTKFLPADTDLPTAGSAGTTWQSTSKVTLRRWTLGEVVTSVANAGLMIQVLEEEPNHKIDDMGIPKTYTLVALK